MLILQEIYIPRGLKHCVLLSGSMQVIYNHKTERYVCAIMKAQERLFWLACIINDRL